MKSGNPLHPHNGHRARMREKLARNTEHTLQDHELLEMLLYYIYPRCDTNKKAHNLLEHFGGKLYMLLDADRAQLTDAGITPMGASLFELLRELHRAYHLSRINMDFTLDDMNSLMNYCINLIDNQKEEQLYIICFDARRQRICDARIAEGTMRNVEVHMRDIVDAVVKAKSESIVLVHNHPNGICAASMEDIKATRLIENYLRTVNITVCDHIVVANGKASSMREKGAFEVNME